MPIEIRMPELSASMTEADLIAWLVAPGDRFEAGEVIAEIETDKSTVELEAPAAGVLLEIKVAEGTTAVKVGEVLAVMDAASAEVEDAPPASRPQSPTIVPNPTAPEAPERSVAAPEVRHGPAESRVAATALARRMADRAGLDLVGLRGSGAGGRIVKADVQAALGAAEMHAPTVRAVPLTPPSAGQMPLDAPYVEVPHSRMRRTIASRLSEAKQTVPHFYLRIECETDRLLAIRSELNAGAEGRRISVNDFAVLAVALALREVPEANVAWTDAALRQFERVDMAVAVATDGGLITPILRSADRKGLLEISEEMRELAARARAGKLRPEEYRGGTFCISNLGMYGIESVYPILNPPQSGILGIGAAQERAVVRGGEVVPAMVMACTLSADHRAVDGAVGAQLLAAFKRRIEDPLEMLL